MSRMGIAGRYKQIAFICWCLSAMPALAADPPTGLLLPGTSRLCDYVRIVRGPGHVQRFNEPLIPGLYDAVPNTPTVTAGQWTLVGPPANATGTSREISIFAAGVRTDRQSLRTGAISASYNKDAGRFTIVNIAMSGLKPDRVPGTLPIEGLPGAWAKEAPTAVFAILYGMRCSNIAPGSLKEFGLFKIVEPATGLELARDPAIQRWMALHPDSKTIPGELIQNVFASTRLGRITGSAMIQSGHDVTGYRTAPEITTETLENLIKSGSINPQDPKYRDLIAGLPLTTRIPFDFSATLLLKPRETNAAPANPGGR